MRREFPKRVRLAAWGRERGRCQECHAKILGGAEYHHGKEDTFGGEPILENCVVLCKKCHRRITGERAVVIAKSNRVRNKFRGIKKKRRTMPGRRFDGTPIPPRWE